ncbi:MAG: ABC transporter substrate-binding protein [Methylococcaceae bacterium]
MNKMWHQKRTQRKKYPITAVMFLFFIAGVVMLPLGAAETPLKKATFMPLWTPQAQFAGYYVALDKGIYARNGIDLKILRAGPGHSSSDALEKGIADFAILCLSSALQHRSAGTEFVNLAQIIQRSSMMLISKKTAGIKTITDMEGKKVGLWGNEVSIPIRRFFANRHIKVREVRQSHTVNLFLRGGVDVTSAMWFNEYHTILDSGIDPEELNVIFLRDQGMNFLEDGIYTMEKTLLKDPALATAFVTASLEGWRYAFDHPDEALDIVLKYMHEAQLPAGRMHQKWMLDRMRELMMPAAPEAGFGQLKELDYLAVCHALQKQGLIRTYPDYAIFSWRADAGKK